MGQYLRHRTIRIPDTSHKIAMGLAIGGAVSFSPLMGTHILQGFLFAFFLRGNYIAVVIGTLIGNPWTFPFIWWASMSLGSFLFGLFGLPASSMLPAVVTPEILWDLFKNDPFRLFLPWMTGGYLLCLLSFPLFYGLYYYLVNGAKIAREKALAAARKRKAEKLAKKAEKEQK